MLILGGEMKLKDAIELICNLEQVMENRYRRDRYEKARFLVRMGVINPDAEVSRGQTAQYRLDTVCALRLCFALYDCGLEFAAVSDIARSFHHPMKPGRDPSPHHSMSSAVEAIHSGKCVVFLVVVSRLIGQSTVSRIGGFEIEGQSSIRQVKSPVVDDAVANEVKISIPLNRPLKKIIDRFNEALE